MTWRGITYGLLYLIFIAVILFRVSYDEQKRVQERCNYPLHIPCP